MKLLTAFGIDYKILLAQFINFAVLLFILYKIGYKPILEFIQERKSTIAKGLDDAKKAEASYHEALQKKESVVTEARTEAQKLISQAEKTAEEVREKAMAKTREEMKQMILDAKKDIELERQKMVDEVKKDVITIVSKGTEKVLGEAVDEKVDQAWLNKQLESIKK